MYGASALAIPVKFGQSLQIEKNNLTVLQWNTFVNNSLWFSASFNNELLPQKTSNKQTALFLSKLLQEARKLNPLFLSDFNADIRSDINFDINWGLGSSSTLIANIARWAKVNPFQLFYKVASGSAYDIACAITNKPIVYRVENQNPDYQVVKFFPDTHTHIYFSYLGKKQKSEESIQKFRKERTISSLNIAQITDISYLMLKTNNLEELAALIHEHEKIMSSVLKQKTVKELYFSDFQGEIKSLGAWGGDFMMIVSEMDFAEVKKYFNAKGINVIFTFEQMAL